jgi:hypothetical protein
MVAHSPLVHLGFLNSAKLTVALLRTVVEVYCIGQIKDGGPFTTCSPRLPKFCRTYCVAFAFRGRVYRIELIKDGGPLAMFLPQLQRFCRTYCVAFAIRGRSVPRRTDQRWRPIRHVFASAPKAPQNLLCRFCDPW